MAVPKLSLLVHRGHFGITPSTLGYFHCPQVPWADPSQPWGGGSRGQGHQRGGRGRTHPQDGDEPPAHPTAPRRGTPAGKRGQEPPCSAPRGWEGDGDPHPSPLNPALGTARAHGLGAFTRAPPLAAVLGSNPAEKNKLKKIQETVKGTEEGYGTAGALPGPVCCSRAALGLLPKP